MVLSGIADVNVVIVACLRLGIGLMISRSLKMHFYEHV
jgi:hypothetical protein